MEKKIQVIYFSSNIRPPETTLTLNGRNILFANSVKYHGVIFDKKNYMETANISSYNQCIQNIY
jgi:hypothetical protein